MLSTLPTELLYKAFSFLDRRSDIISLALVNSYISQVAIRHLYSMRLILSPRGSTRLLLSILKSPNALSPQRACTSQLHIHLENINPLPSLLYLLRDVLCLLPALLHLHLDIYSTFAQPERTPYSLAWLLPVGAPFRLRYLNTSIEVDHNMLAFLEEQTDLLRLTLRGTCHQAVQFFPSPEHFLPRLQGLEWPTPIDETLTITLLSGRPISTAAFVMSVSTSSTLLKSLPVSVEKLEIWLSHYEDRSRLLAHIAEYAPGIQTLFIRCTRAFGVTQGLLLQWADALPVFNNLVYIHISGPRLLGEGGPGEERVAKAFMSLCRDSLAMIVLPSTTTWVKFPDKGWILYYQPHYISLDEQWLGLGGE